MAVRRHSDDVAPQVTTWDGLPVADEPPHGAVVVCVHYTTPGPEVLLLHRAHRGASYEGDWAWTPPSGARLPNETVVACARRELREEVGLELNLTVVDVDRDWAIFVAEVPDGAEIRLDAEHDRYEWVSIDETKVRCMPSQVAQSILLATDTIRSR